MNYFLQVLQNYATFRGRARRSEYWYFVLFKAIFSILAVILGAVAVYVASGDIISSILMLYLIWVVAYLALLIPTLAVLVRRLHDVGKSGWFFFVSLIPLVGVIWLIVLLVTEGEPFENKYGLNPKAVDPELEY